MFAAFALAVAAATPVVAVVHDGSASAEVHAAATHLSATGRVTATAGEAALAASCVRSTACPDRPAADFLLVVTKTATKVHLELVDKSGTTVSIEDVDVTDPAVLDAALAPALDRIATKASEPPHASTSTSSTASETASSGDNGWIGWVLGGAGACVAVGAGGCCLLALASKGSTTTGGNTTTGGTTTGGNTGGGASTGFANACSAPFDACGQIGNSCTTGVDACGNASNAGTNACGSVGNSLSGACTSLGNVGSCAVMPAAALAAPAGRAPDETGREYAPGAMRY